MCGFNVGERGRTGERGCSLRLHCMVKLHYMCNRFMWYVVLRRDQTFMVIKCPFMRFIISVYHFTDIPNKPNPTCYLWLIATTLIPLSLLPFHPHLGHIYHHWKSTTDWYLFKLFVHSLNESPQVAFTLSGKICFRLGLQVCLTPVHQLNMWQVVEV